jgi:tetratricopeptide (TPR) repeat protein
MPVVDPSQRGAVAAATRNCAATAHQVLRLGAILMLVGLVWLPAHADHAQSPASSPAGAAIRGIVLDAHAAPVAGAVVRLTSPGGTVQTATTTREGRFAFAGINPGDYSLSAEARGASTQTVSISVQGEHGSRTVRLRWPGSRHLQPGSASPAPPPPAMKFSDQPSFTVAGVTDWTAVGGHGSDANLRASEALARDTLKLKPVGRGSGAAPAQASPAQISRDERNLKAQLAAAPGSFAPNHQLGEMYLHSGRYQQAVGLLESAWRIDPGNEKNTWDLALACQGVGDYRQARSHVTQLLAHGDQANWYRLAGDLDEQLGDPLTAVRDYQRAVQLNPSEQNYFSLGSDLLLHRAIWQAQAVFRAAAAAYPRSVRMLTGFGAALFAGALYSQAARQLCTASDLAPADPEPYIFMGKIEIASPNPLPCVQTKLARFVRLKPSDTTANYLCAMAILKAQERTPNPPATQHAKALLSKAVALDPQNGQAWLALGDLSAAGHDYPRAIRLYRKAIGADPQLSDAYYRLGVAYDRSGNRTLAQQQFRLHDEIAKSQTEAVDRQRRRIQQFLFVQNKQQPAQPNP